MDQRLGSSSDDVLRRPVLGGRGLTTEERRQTDLSDRIRGWGSDLDPARRPGVPRDAAPEIGIEYLYPGIAQQQPRFRIHKSTEHARLTPVFGTSCPPRGLSGMLRSFAYRYSEGRMVRWLTLMFADRVDVVEAAARDVVARKPPNVVSEMGLRSEWRYNRPAVIRKAIVAGVIIASAGVLIARLQSRPRRHSGS